MDRTIQWIVLILALALAGGLVACGDDDDDDSDDDDDDTGGDPDTLCEFVTEIEEPFTYLDLATDAAGETHVTVVGDNGAGEDLPRTVHYFTRSSGDWPGGDIGTQNGQGCGVTLVVSDSGTAYVAYNGEVGDGGFVRVATDAGGSWTSEKVASTDFLPSWRPGLTLGSDDRPVVSFATGENDPTALYLATYDGTQWSDQQLLAGDASPLLATFVDVDADGTTHVVFGETGDAISYATDRSGDWAVEAVGVFENPRLVAFEVEAGGTAHVLMMDDSGDEESFRYATNGSGAWETERVTGPHAYIQAADLALDETGVVHLVFVTDDDSEPNTNVVNYASGTFDSWTVGELTFAKDPDDPSEPDFMTPWDDVAIDVAGDRVYLVFNYTERTYYAEFPAGSGADIQCIGGNFE